MTTTSTVLRTTTTAKPTSQAAPVPLLSAHCKSCPPNNAQGLTCYKNTQCVPIALLCSAPTGNTTTGNQTVGPYPCMDTTGLPPTYDPIDCKDQLCYPENYLPLPAPGSGRIDSNSLDNCLKGNYFSLYGPSSGEVRYTRSCIGQFPARNTVTCQAWEYRGQNSCFLKTCGTGMDCEPPFVCRIKNTTSSPTAQFGLCLNPKSPVDPDDDGDVDTTPSRDKLIIGILVGVCALVVIAGVAAAFWHYRKLRLKQLNQDNDYVFQDKTMLLYACCIGTDRLITRRRGTAEDDRSTREPRVVSIAEPENPEDASSTTEPPTNTSIFARRWRSQARLDASTTGMTPEGIAVVPEMEPPPVYHQELELPSYGTDAIPLEPINTTNTRSSESMSPPTSTSATGASAPDNHGEQATIPSSGSK